MENVLDDLLTSLHLATSYFWEKYPEFSDKVQADCLFSCNFTVRRSSRKTVFSVLLIFWHLSGCILVRPYWGIEGLMSLTPTHPHTQLIELMFYAWWVKDEYCTTACWIALMCTKCVPHFPGNVFSGYLIRARGNMAHIFVWFEWGVMKAVIWKWIKGNSCTV